MRVRLPARFRLVVLAASLGLLWGCGPDYLSRKADEEVYGIVQQKTQAVTGEERDFTIEPIVEDPLENRGRVVEVEEPPADPAALPIGPRQRLLVSLDEALEIAARHSREYQTRKENVYLEGLNLTLERFRWEPQLALNLSARWTGEGETGESLDERLRGRSEFSVQQILVTGGRVGARFTNNALRFMTGSRNSVNESLIVFDIVQPLWRGAGARVALESLTQAERDMIYEIRRFIRFQKGFTVDIASSYYRLLQQRDRVANEEGNYRNLVESRERAELLARAGRLPEFQVSEARQNELRAQNRWVRAQEDYRRQLDSFRIALGLPTDEPVEPDPEELDRMRERGLIMPDFELQEAVALALARRMDYLITLDSIEDAKRKIEVARNSLGWDITTRASAGYGSTATGNLADYRFNQQEYELGLELEVPLQQKAERNAYMRSLITYERRKRDEEGDRERIKQQVRSAWGRLREATESFRIQQMSVELASERVEGTLLLLEAGRARTRDYLDAQEDLVNAQNDLTGALMDHTVARLEFFRDIELLEVDEDGQWYIPERAIEQFTNIEDKESGA